MSKNVLLVTDNIILLNEFRKLVKRIITDSEYTFEYAYSSNNKAFKTTYAEENWIRPLNIKQEVDSLIEYYDIIFSLHCKQLFPSKLVRNVKCINVHPGLNPYNRGWFPQVFCIINGLPLGATIHEIDEKLDHGGIIAQREVIIEPWDTSFTAYSKVIGVEIELLEESFVKILKGDYSTSIPEEGNINLKADFDMLCEINLDDMDTFRNHINKLRALTHGEYDNAFFRTKKGEKVYLSLSLRKEV
jgi:methionyl-tRNA formyltransferase